MVSKKKLYVGFKNYITLFNDPLAIKILINSFIYIVFFIIFSCVVPYIMSFILDQIILRWKDFYKGMFFMPAVVSLVVASILYTWILNPISGPIALILKQFNIVMPYWSKIDVLVIFVISAITSWKVFGYNFIVLYAAVAGVSRELIESAKLDNVSNMGIFLKVILPMSSSTGIYIFIMTIVQGLQYVFTPIKVITQGGPDYASSNLIYYSYQQAFEMYNTGLSSAMSVVTMLLFAILLILEFALVERKVYYEN